MNRKLLYCVIFTISFILCVSVLFPHNVPFPKQQIIDSIAAASELTLVTSHKVEAPVITDALVLYPSGGDDTKALQALYNNANDGDTIRPTPLNGNATFHIYSALNWTGTKNVNVDGAGSRLYCNYVLSGTNAMITWGAPLGARNTANVYWHGCIIQGSLAIQNLSYCDISPLACDCMIIQGDMTCGYNSIHCVGGFAGACGNGYGLIFNGLSQSSCLNNNAFYDCPLKGSYGSAAIWVVNSSVSFIPSSEMFYHTDHEGNFPMFNGTLSATFQDSYIEGNVTTGTLGDGSSITVARPYGGPPWDDAHVWFEGTRQK